MLSLDPRNSLSKTLSLDPHSSLTVPVPLRTSPYISYKRNLYVLLINTLILYERDSQIFFSSRYVITYNSSSFFNYFLILREINNDLYPHIRVTY